MAWMKIALPPQNWLLSYSARNSKCSSVAKVTRTINLHTEVQAQKITQIFWYCQNIAYNEGVNGRDPQNYENWSLEHKNDLRSVDLTDCSWYDRLQHQMDEWIMDRHKKLGSQSEYKNKPEQNTPGFFSNEGWHFSLHAFAWPQWLFKVLFHKTLRCLIQDPAP